MEFVENLKERVVALFAVTKKQDEAEPIATPSITVLVDEVVEKINSPLYNR